MPDIIKAKLKIDAQLIEAFEKQADLVVKFDDLDQAKEFIRVFWPQIEADRDLVKNKPDYFSRLNKIFAYCSIVAIPTLSDKKLIGLFEKEIAWYFRDLVSNFSLWDKVRSNLVVIYPRTDRNVLKEKIRKALLANDERITDKDISRNNETYPPTIKQWLLDFTSVVGNEYAESVKLNSYFIQNLNFQKLDDKEKGIIRELITFYNRIKLSSNKLEGYEEKIPAEDEDGSFILNEGRYEKVDQDILSLLKKFEAAGEITPEMREQISEVNKSNQSVYNESSLQEIINAYQGDNIKEKAINLEIEKFNKTIKGNATKLQDEFYKAVQDGNSNKTIATLYLLSKNNQLLDFIKSDLKLKNFLSATWAKKYGQVIVDDFSNNPTKPKFLKMFLQYVLQERLGLNENDAARVGMHISNQFANQGKTEYNKLAYFDVAAKSFKWFTD